MNAMLNVNEEMNGIELFFEGKPAKETRDTLKENGFRWSKFKKCWYNKQSENAFKVAENLTNGTVEKAAETKTTNKTKANKKVKFNLWNATQWTDMEVNNNQETKAMAKEIRQHLKKRFPNVKFSIRSDYNRINADIKQSPYEEGSIYLNAIKEYADKLINAYKVCHMAGDPYTDLPASYNFYFFGTSIDYDYTQTEATEEIKEDMKNFDKQLEEFEKVEQEREEKEFQEYLKQEEIRKAEYEKQREEEKKQHEQISNNVDVNELEESEQYFIIGSEFAHLNKNNTLDQYKEEVQKGAYNLENVKVTKELHFNNKEDLENYSNMLMHGFDFLTHTGGSYTEDERINSMTDFYNMDSEERKTVQWNLQGVAVYFNNKLQFVIDASGHDYARYVGLTDNATIEKEASTKHNINDEELEELNYKADLMEELSSQVIRENNIMKTWNNEDWNEYKEIMKAKLKEYEIKPTKAIIQQIEIEELKACMYKLLTEVDGIQDQFKEADLQQGEKLTLFYISDFGSIVTSRITLDSVENTSFAQYNNAVKLTFTPERKRKLHYNFFYSTLLVYKGWHALPENVLHEVEERNGMRVSKSKYFSTDKKQYDEILDYFKNEKELTPVVNTYKPTF